MWLRGDLSAPPQGRQRARERSRLRDPAHGPIASFLLLVDRNHGDKPHEAAWIAAGPSVNT